MGAKENAEAASLENTDARLQKVVERQERDESEPKVYAYQGHDPKSGKSLIKSLGCCTGDEGTTATGDRLTNAAIRQGEVVMSRQTQGFTRLDKKPVLTDSETGEPINRDSKYGIGFVIEDEDEEEEPTLEDPPVENEPVELSSRCVGLAFVYEEYTGEVLEDGTFETRTITIPNDPRCQSPTEPQSPVDPDDDGCVKPGLPPKRCQWFDVTAAQAASFSGCPDGMFNSGGGEFPAGSFRALCCSEDGESITEGIGRNWQGKNAIASGAALNGVGYCGDSYIGEIVVAGQSFVSEAPPIAFSKSGDVVTVSDTSGSIGTYQLKESDLVVTAQGAASPGATYCEGAQADLRWSLGSFTTSNPPFSFTLSSGNATLAQINQVVNSATPPIGTLGNRCLLIADPRTSIGYQGVIYASPPSSYPNDIYQADAGGCGSAKSPRSKPGTGIWALSVYSSDQGEFAVLMFGRPSGSLTIDVGDPTIVESSADYALAITDGDGTTSYSYDTEPTDFSATCYDYAITPQYVCRTNTKVC